MFSHRSRPVLAAGLLVLLLAACRDEPTAPNPKPDSKATTVHAAVSSTVMGGMVDIGSFGFGSNPPIIGNSGSVAGNMVADAAGHARGAFWSPSSGLIDLGLLTEKDCQDGEWVMGIGASDEVVGWALGSCPQGAIYAIRWTASAGMRTLPVPPSAPYTTILSQATAVNVNGVVAGQTLSSKGGTVPVVWRPDGSWTTASLPEPYTTATTVAINASGQVTGYLGCYFGCTAIPAFVWTPTVNGSAVQLLPSLGGSVQPTDINDNGTVVGFAVTASGEQHPFRWTASGGIEDLGTLGGTVAEAVGVANDESIAGWSYLSGTSAWRAFRWTPYGGLQSLGLLPGSPAEGSPYAFMTANDISRTGVITGTGTVATPEGGAVNHAFRWTPRGGLEDLGALSGGSSQGYSVNDDGYVAGFYWPEGEANAHWARWSATNHSPTADAGGPYEAAEGKAVTLSAESSTDVDGDPLAFVWDFGDGSAPLTTTATTVDHTYADNGTYAISLTADDGRQGSGVDTTHATVTNVAPKPSAPTTATARPGVSYSFSATFTDPGSADAPWKYGIDWGDGSESLTGEAASQTGPIQAGHVFASAGTAIVKLTITDKDGGVGTSATTVTIMANRPPRAVISAPTSWAAGQLLTLSGAGSTDPDGDALSYAWHFSDGTDAEGATITHDFDSPGNYTVTLTVSDDHGGQASATQSISIVLDSPPSVQIVSGKGVIAKRVPLAVLPGDEALITVIISDPDNPSGPWNVDIDWGDDSSDTRIATPLPGASDAELSISHRYDGDPGPRTISVSATDIAGALGSDQVAIQVAIPVSVVPVACGFNRVCQVSRSSANTFWFAVLGAPGIDPYAIRPNTAAVGDNGDWQMARCGSGSDSTRSDTDINNDGYRDNDCSIARYTRLGTPLRYFTAALVDGRVVMGKF